MPADEPTLSHRLASPRGSSLPCPVCLHATHARFVVDGYRLLACPACAHRFFDVVAGEDHVARVYDDAYFNGGGAGYPDYLAEGALLRARGRWYARKLARHVRVGRLLDVGAAAGFVMAGFRDRGWDVEGVEPNASMSRYAREVLGLPMITADFLRFETGHRYDVIAMIQVIAHFADPAAAIAKAASLLRPEGHVLIETWNCRSLTARVFGRHWHEYSPPSVLHCFSRRSLDRLMSKSALRKVAHGHPSKRIGVAHAKSLLRHKFGGSRWLERLLSRIPDRGTLPYPAEDLQWYLFRSA